MSAINILAATFNLLPPEVERFVESRKEKSLLPTIFQRPPKRIKQYNFENFVIYASENIGSVEFDYCCHPKRNDPIVAFRFGNKAVVHHKFCEKAYTWIRKHAPMLFVEWSESKLIRFRILVTLKDEKGALAKLLGFLAKIDTNVISIRLGEGSAQSNLCELVVESKEYDRNRLKLLLERRFKVIEMVNLTDAYKQLP